VTLDDRVLLRRVARFLRNYAAVAYAENVFRDEQAATVRDEFIQAAVDLGRIADEGVRNAD